LLWNIATIPGVRFTFIHGGCLSVSCLYSFSFSLDKFGLVCLITTFAHKKVLVQTHQSLTTTYKSYLLGSAKLRSRISGLPTTQTKCSLLEKKQCSKIAPHSDRISYYCSNPLLNYIHSCRHRQTNYLVAHTHKYHHSSRTNYICYQ